MAKHPTRPVTELDLRMPEFRDPDLKLEELEFRSSDGKIVRKDRWETAIYRIGGLLGISSGRKEWEISDVVKKVDELFELSEQLNRRGYIIQNSEGKFLDTTEDMHFVGIDEAQFFRSLGDAQKDLEQYGLKDCAVKYAQALISFSITEDAPASTAADDVEDA